MDTSETKKSISSSMAWALLERVGNQTVSLVISIVLARLLMPEDYGVLAIITVFTNLASQMVHNGFSSSLIQSKDLKEEDYSSVFFITLLLGAAFYAVIWATAPLISRFYEMPALIAPLRVQALLLFVNALQAVQAARLKREMQFKKLFSRTLVTSVLGGIVGIIFAYLGLGVWALVAQQLASSLGSCAILWYYQRWIPTFRVNWRRVRELFSYGWKILVGSMVHSLYSDLRAMVIGKRYSSTDLAYYDKGQLLPNKIISNVGAALQSVLFSTLARKQKDLILVKQIARKTVQLSAFLIFPMLAGMAATAPAVIEILLTDKWLESVPFMQLSCIVFAVDPILATNLQISKALGRSDLFLKVELARKVVGLGLLFAALVFFDSPLAIMASAAVLAPIEMLISAIPGKVLIKYSVREQLQDIALPLLLSVGMFYAVSAIEGLVSNVYLTLALQVSTGVTIYACSAALLKAKSFYYLLGMLKGYAGKLSR